MSKRARVVIAFLVIEILLAGIWFYLTGLRVHEGANGPNDGSTQAAVEGIGSIMGMAMGGFFGLFVLLYFVAAKNDRQA